MRRDQSRYMRWWAPALFLCGLIAGAVCMSLQPATAQQRFGKDDLKSVPESFLEGGDGSYTMLKEIARTSQAAADSLARIEIKTGDADKRHRELMKKVDSLDARLKQLHDVIDLTP